MIIELKEIGFECHSQKQINVFYKNMNVNEYFADIIVEFKAVESIIKEQEPELLNYL